MNKIHLEFECPQFVDFAAELNSSVKEDVFFDCKDHPSPENEKAHKSPPTNISEKYPTEEEENRLIDKMTTALSIIENTPKLKVNTIKGKLLSEKFSSNLCSPTVKPAFKANTVLRPNAGLHRSKSIARLNKIITENTNKSAGPRKRSSSLNDLRTYKKQTYPMTPMCLKRTNLIKAKGKVIKTTEEKELEEIAKLQKQLIQHLRHNEMTLKRLKLKPRPCIVSKNTQSQTENIKGNKGLNPFMDKLNATERNARRNIHTVNSAALKNEAVKIENIIKSWSHKSTDKGLKDDNKKAKYLSVSSAVCAEANEKNKILVAKKPMTGRKYGFHSGLVFHDNIKKSTTVQPFTFEAKIKEKVQSIVPEQKAEVSLSNSTLKHKVDDGKENISCAKPLSTLRKTKGIQNVKCDIVKQLASSKKIIEKRVTNPVKGLPLSENLARN